MRLSVQKVSKRYAKSMKKPIRDRGYIEVSFGIINQKAQEKASVVENGNFAYYTNNKNIFDSQVDRKRQYATFEENFTKLDGTMYFLPRENSGLSYYDTGLISKNIISEPYELTINLNINPTEIKGLTIDFGENYAVNFDIVTASGTINVVNNVDSRWETQDIIGPTNYIKLIVYSMKNPNARLRINSILFGYGLVYGNEYVIDSQLESYVSPICQDVPQIDFSVTLNNQDHYFNVDEPDSAINYLETGQDINVKYGYELTDGEEPEIEWVQGCKLKCSDWEATDTTATIRGQDLLRSMDSKYYKGFYVPDRGRSFYDLALDVFHDAGETDFYIDPRLKSIYTNNPLPIVSHKEALQMIANACRCILFQTREGTISIKSNFKPEITVSSNGETSYSSVSNILDSSVKEEYASYSYNYSRLDENMHFLPRSGTSGLNTGYISSYQSNSNKEFSTNPIITLTQEAQCSYGNLRIVFGNSQPEEFIIRTYNSNSLVETLTFPNEEYEIEKDMYIVHNFDDLDKMEIEFTKTINPYNRITVNNIFFDIASNFIMETNDMTSPPKAIKKESIQEVEAFCYLYQPSANEEQLFSEQKEFDDNETRKIFFSEPCYNLTAKLDGSTSGIQIINSGSYYVEVKITSGGSHTIDVFGYKFKIVECSVSKIRSLDGQKGVTKKWCNPLVSDMSTADSLSMWLMDYYNSSVEYEYDMRGYPELDVNDIIRQERKTKSGTTLVDVNVYRHTIKFDQAFSGKVVSIRQEADI